MPFDLVAGDLRRLPFADRTFELILCVSTLEHIGYDNTVYGLGDERDPDGIQQALSELQRVLALSGRVLVTVPCGEHRDYGWFAQQTPDEWRALYESAFMVSRHDVFELTARGWRRSRRFDPEGVLCYTRGPGASAVLCSELHH